MSVGKTLGKVFGGIGTGLSFLGPIGMGVGAALSAAGGIAGAVGDKKEEERRLQEEEQARMQQANQLMDPMQNGNERPQQAQIDNTQQATPQPPQRNVFTPVSNTGVQGGYQNQLQQSIIPSVILGGNDPFGGP